jgi:type IV secretion system protein VirB10
MKAPEVRCAALTLAAVLGFSCAGRAQQTPPPAAPSAVSAQPQVPPGFLTVKAGERLVLELETSLHTRNSKKGERVYFRTVDHLQVGNEIAVPRDSKVQATVTKVKRPGRIKGRAEIQLRFDDLVLADGTKLPLHVSIVRAGFSKAGATKEGDPQIKGETGSGGSVVVVAQGGLQGAMIGIWTGSAKGVGYGAAIGAIIGLGTVLVQRGPDLDLPRSTMFEAKVTSPIQVPVAAARLAAAQRSGSGLAPAGTDEPASPPVRAAAEPEERPSPPRPVLRRDRDTRQEEPPPIIASTPPDAPPPSAPARPAPAPGSETTPAESSGYKLSVEVPLVVVEAVARDRAGRPMDNLTREDFRAFENGIEQTIRDFSRDQLPLAIALVIDRSGSVAPFMPELRESAYRALSELKRGDTVALFAFASDVERLEDLTTDRQRIADRIAQIHGGGGTDIIDAIFEAVYYLGMVAPDRRRAVILISDNEPTVRPRASEAHTIRMALETETAVYSIKTPGEAVPITMRLPSLLSGAGSVPKITRETGGEIIDVAGSGGIGAALNTALSRLRLRYTLGYYPSEPFRDTSFRSIEVRLSERFGQAGADYAVLARRGYYPPSKKPPEPGRP